MPKLNEDSYEEYKGICFIRRMDEFTVAELMVICMERNLDVSKVKVGCGDSGMSHVYWEMKKIDGRPTSTSE